MPKKFKDMKLNWKLNIINVLVIAIVTAIVYSSLVPYFENEKTKERKGKLKAVVNSTVSMMDHYERFVRQKLWVKSNDKNLPQTIDEAKAYVLNNIRELRYDKAEYFFILDTNGNMVMHPLKPELEGINMLDVTDSNGDKIFEKLVYNSQRDGEAFEYNVWQSKYSSVTWESQITYAKYFWPWNLIVCSSLYTQDITEAMNELKAKILVYSIITAILMTSILGTIIFLSVSTPLKKLLTGINAIDSGDLSYRVKSDNKDEIGFITDEFNKMTDTLEESRKNLTLSEQKFKDLTDMLPDIVFEGDNKYKITYLNRAGIELTGYGINDISNGLYIENLLSDNEAAHFKKMLEAQISNKSSKNIFFSHKIKNKNGSSFNGETKVSFIIDNNQILSFRASTRDVTEKLKMEQTLLQSQKMETIGILTSGIAHDFNNILAGIVSTVSIAEYELANNEYNRDRFIQYIDIMKEAGERASDMIQQLLSISRKYEVTFKPIDIADTIRQVFKICKSSFDKRIILQKDIPDEPITVYADRTQIEQVILNLMINASHAMTLMRPNELEYGGTLTLSVDKTSSDTIFCNKHPEAELIDYWKISVNDTGIGMDPATISKIFIPFFTTKKKGQGTGLGLSMVYNIIHEHKGFIDVYSEPGIGSTFNIYIPQYNGQTGTSLLATDPVIYHGSGVILVADDEEYILLLAKSILEKSGYTVITAEDGEDAVKKFIKYKDEITAILLDLVMPKKSGEQVYNEIKALKPEIKVLMTSGFKLDERVSAAVRSGINGFIQKPYTLEKLSKAIHEIIHGKQQ